MTTGHLTLKRDWKTIADDGMKLYGIGMAARDLNRAFEENKNGKLKGLAFAFSCGKCGGRMLIKAIHIHSNHWVEDAAAPSVACPVERCGSTGDHHYLGAESVQQQQPAW